MDFISQIKPNGNSGIAYNLRATVEYIDTTLLATSWTGSSAPYEYVYANNKITATSIQEWTVRPTGAQAAAQVEAWTAAIIQDGGQASHSATLKAYGDKPSIDIPVRIYFLGLGSDITE